MGYAGEQFKARVSQREMIIIAEAFTMQHSRRDRPSGLSDGQQWTNLKVCPYSGASNSGMSDSGVFEGIFE